jgi:hypothetical protein
MSIEVMTTHELLANFFLKLIEEKIIMLFSNIHLNLS